MGLKKPAPTISNKKLTLNEVIEAMVEDGLLTADQGEHIKEKKRLSRHHPLISVAEFNIKDPKNPKKTLTIDDLTEWLASYAGMDYFEVDPLKVEIDVITKVLPKAYVSRLQVLPVEILGDTITIATSEPFQNDWVQDAERSTKKSIRLVVASPVIISQCIHEFFTVRSAIKNLTKDTKSDDVDGGRMAEIDKMLNLESSNLRTKDEKGISGIVDWLFGFAFNERATDIHFEPKQGQGVIRFRIDGRLRIVYKFDPEVLLPVLSRIKLMAGMKIDEKRLPQDGRIKRRLDDERLIEIRASTIPTHYGEKLVLRIFDPKMAEKSIEQLGFSDVDLKRWKEVISHSHGIVLVTGPTGSGKSTTLHAALKSLVSPEVNICTAEDPIEIINDDFNQMQISGVIGLNFAEAIRSFMRQDPDIIMVGEIRDKETAEMAIQASLTGHMVFSTLHTNDALSSITRMLDLGVQPHLLNATVKGILAQRLIRVLCPSCKEKIKTPIHLWKSLVAPYNVAPPEHVNVPKGCKDCKNTGYIGRHCVYELVIMNDNIRAKIENNVELLDLQKVAHGTFTPIRICGAKKVIDGLTNIEEVLRVVI